MKNVVMGILYTVIISGALAYFAGCYDTKASVKEPVAAETSVSNEFAAVLKDTLEGALQEAIMGSNTETAESEETVEQTDEDTAGENI